MKTLILCESRHHGNTRKLVDAIAEKFQVEVCDVAAFTGDLSKYDLIGFASGVAFGRMYSELLTVALDKMPFEKDIFILCTSASPVRDYGQEIREAALQRGCRVHGSYCCRGFANIGPLKLFGGINKGCPTEQEIRGAVQYYQMVLLECSAAQMSETAEGPDSAAEQ